MPATIRAASAATLILCALGSPAGAVEEKSTKPRIAVIEFSGKAEAKLEVDAVSWGEWIADVERPRAAGSWAKADGLGVSWDAPESGSSAARANDRLRSAGPKDGWPAAGRGMDIAQVDGEIVNPSSTAARQPKSRPMVLAPGGTAPRPASSREKGGTEDINIGVGELQESRGGISVAAGDISGDGAAASPKKPITKPGLISPRPLPGMTGSAAPLERGSVMLRLAQPWAGCKVGDRFNGIYLTTGASHRYRLGEAQIVSCDGSTMTINYTRFSDAG